MDFSNVKTVIGESDPVVRDGIKSALRDLGFRDVLDLPTLVKVHHSIRRESVDLIVLNSWMEQEDSSFIVEDIRCGKLGLDPFAIIIMLIGSEDIPRAKAIAGCGADDAILLPFAADALTKKIASLAGPRKPFVVTFNYIGPERRAMARNDGHSARQIPVPNPLFSGEGETVYVAHREEARAQIYAERISRVAFQIVWQAEQIITLAATEPLVSSTFRPIEDLAKDLTSRPLNPAQSEAVQQLVSLVRGLKAVCLHLPQDELQILLQAAHDVATQFPPLP